MGSNENGERAWFHIRGGLYDLMRIPHKSAASCSGRLLWELHGSRMELPSQCLVRFGCGLVQAWLQRALAAHTQ